MGKTNPTINLTPGLWSVQYIETHIAHAMAYGPTPEEAMASIGAMVNGKTILAVKALSAKPLDFQTQVKMLQSVAKQAAEDSSISDDEQED